MNSSSNDLTKQISTPQFTNLAISSEPSLSNQLTNAPLGQRSLVGIAGKLFSLFAELKKQTQSYQVEQLRPYLLKEIQQFADTAARMGHTEETVLISQFVIARGFDELIQASHWETKTDWDNHHLTSALPHTQTLEANFVNALQKMSDVPDIFIDILEFIYICQSLTDSQYKKAALNQELYYLIQQQRGEFDKRLAKKSQVPTLFKTKPRQLGFWLFFSGVILLTITTYVSFDYLLQQSSLKLTQQLNLFPINQQNHPQ